jgi:hypothetical protein
MAQDPAIEYKMRKKQIVLLLINVLRRQVPSILEPVESKRSSSSSNSSSSSSSSNQDNNNNNGNGQESNKPLRWLSELHLLAVVFLKKLSLYKENVEDMVCLFVCLSVSVCLSLSLSSVSLFF